MSVFVRLRLSAWVVVLALLTFGATITVAFQVRQKASRFDALVVDDPSSISGITTMAPDALPSGDARRAGWDTFRSAHGQQWSVWLDRRSGAPTLVEGRGISLAVGGGNGAGAGTPITLDSIETALRAFAAGNRTLLLANDSELVLNRAASGQRHENLWQVVFDRHVAGVPVVGDRYVFAISHGRLVQFGASRWSRVNSSPVANFDANAARDLLYAYMGINAQDSVKVNDGGTLQFIPLRTGDMAYAGPVGGGYGSTLAYRITLVIGGEPGTWVGLVDAHTGAILALYDDNDYAQAKGGVYPVSNDGIPPDGVEQAAYPMPFANITIGASTSFASTMGSFNCTPGGSTATTTLAGQYVRVVDTCGAILQSVSCDADLDLSQSAGTDCTVPPGGSAGDTHASRTGFYHLNRISEHGRAWLPGNAWLSSQLTDNVNLNQTCNAYWNGSSVNFFKSGGGCRNTGEIAGVFLHEWGHGLDANDGGGMDNPSEAYADIAAFMSTHVSCIGRGFDMTSDCSGYGNACLDCTGIRDQDWDMRANHVPSTPSGFLTTNCGGGGGPCGKEVHCEGYVGAETLWDLAVRDLPASGLDAATSWQLADKLWYKSRAGSGGNAYTCALPNSDGCAATSWFSKLRVQDDDDGNLANGTPHAAAIYAAFNRHKIACGLATDASNQNSSSCPAIAAPVVTATAGSSAISLSWTPVANAASYLILRNDAGCSAGSTVVATVAAPATNYTDTGLANGFSEYYHVQARGTNPACDGMLSNCETATPQPFAGTIKLDAASYSCSGTITMSVTDANIGATTTSVNIASTTEPGGETLVLTQISPGSANYSGTIATTAAAPGSDGLLSVADGDTITGTYIDADDGVGGVNVVRTTTAGADCVFPIITNVQSSNVTGNSARVTWTTNENANSVVHYGLATPPASTATIASLVTAHTSDLIGLTECSDYFYSVQSADSVGNTALDDAAGTYYTFATGKNTQPNYPYTGPPVAILDNDPTGATATITVPDSKTIVDVNVTINSLTHTYDGDLVLHLIGPDNTDVVLSSRRGGGGQNFISTTFDDSATTAISAGVAPFTGSFRPDIVPVGNALSLFNGKNAAGTWRLFVVDQADVDIGTIDSWTLSLTFPAAACGPHALYNSHALVSDSCSTGGGGGNALWEAGEQVQFKVNLNNDGTVALTGVTATVTSTTPGVTVVDGSASYPDIPTATTADSAAPNFTVYLSTSLACGSTVAFQITVNANEGSWVGSFSQAVGLAFPGSGTALSENFAGGIPATWSIVDGGSGGGLAATWTTANPGSRTIASPMTAPVAIVDSDAAGTLPTQDEELITPAMNLSTATSATLNFDQYFRYWSGGLAEIIDVDVRSSLTGGAWVNVLRQQGASSPNPDHKMVDITAQAAGAADAQLRFHYYQAQFEYYWQLDNVIVTYTAPSGCNQAVCAAPPASVKPVPDGSFGSVMTGSRADISGTTIDVAWDVSTCASTGYHMLYGDLATVASYAISGSACAIGTSGSYSWPGVPAGDLWFVVAADDGGTTEGSWGTGVGGAERGGTSASGQCSMAARDNSGTCP